MTKAILIYVVVPKLKPLAIYLDKIDAENEIERRAYVRSERLKVIEAEGGSAGADWWTHAQTVEIDIDLGG
jgi:hypothetical protein